MLRVVVGSCNGEAEEYLMGHVNGSVVLGISGVWVRLSIVGFCIVFDRNIC